MRPQETLGTRIRQARLARGWKQEEFAERIGVSPTTVVNWETDNKPPGRKNMLRLSEELQVSIDWLAGGQERETTSGHLPEDQAPATGARVRRARQTERDVLVQRLDEVLERLERIERALRDR